MHDGGIRGRSTASPRDWMHNRQAVKFKRVHTGAVNDARQSDEARTLQTTIGKATNPMKQTKTGAKEGKDAAAPSQLIDARIEELGDWRGDTLARVRRLIKEACPEAVETWKWRGVPVFESDGILCTGETYKAVVKLTFANGAALDDPAKLFNSSLEGNVRRAIDIREGETVDAEAFKALVQAAATANVKS